MKTSLLGKKKKAKTKPTKPNEIPKPNNKDS